jgi:N-terminal domain on NACHT_NTPase and P-loop NTPases
MAEALAVISIIANIISLVDVTVKIYDAAKDFGDNVDSLPKMYREARDRLPLILDALEKTKENAEAGNIDNETCKALKPVLTQCSANVETLQALFKDIVPAQNASALRVGYKAVSSVLHRTKVDTVMKRILEDVNVLVSYHVVRGATKEQVAELAKTIAQLSVASRKAPPVPDSPAVIFLMPLSASEDMLLGREICMKWLDSKLCVAGKHCRAALLGLGGIG